jgi:hypothetical protein
VSFLKETGMSRRTSAPIALLAGALALAACSHLSNMDHLGSAAAGTENQARQQPGPNTPTGTIDPRNASGTPAPPRTLPIPGQAQDPFASKPQGALPDPYANPPR